MPYQSTEYTVSLLLSFRPQRQHQEKWWWSERLALAEHTIRGVGCSFPSTALSEASEWDNKTVVIWSRSGGRHTVDTWRMIHVRRTDYVPERRWRIGTSDSTVPQCMSEWQRYVAHTWRCKSMCKRPGIWKLSVFSGNCRSLSPKNSLETRQSASTICSFASLLTRTCTDKTSGLAKGQVRWL